MRIGYITFMVRDIESSISFYRELAGLKVLKRFNPGRGEIAFMADAEGETMIELVQFDFAAKADIKGMVLSFCADDIESVRERASALGYSPTIIISEGAKPAYFTVTDPDGITVEFSS